jgi:hypothetical protein
LRVSSFRQDSSIGKPSQRVVIGGNAARTEEILRRRDLLFSPVLDQRCVPLEIEPDAAQRRSRNGGDGADLDFIGFRRLLRLESRWRDLGNAAAAANVAQTQPAAPASPKASSFPSPWRSTNRDDRRRGENSAHPGMTVTVEIKTDSRRVIDYLLSPLARIASEAARER